MARRRPYARAVRRGYSGSPAGLPRARRPLERAYGALLIVAALVLAAAPAWARSSYFQGRFGAGGAAMAITGANTDLAALNNIAAAGGAMTLAPAPAATLTTDQAQAVGGSTMLPFAATIGTAAGQTVQGTSVPLGDKIASIVSAAQVTRAANGAFLTAQPVIPMATTAGFAAGQQCADTTGAGVIGAGNVILSVQANVSITLTSNVLTASVGAADSITCDPVVTLTTATSAAVGSGASVKFFTNHAALSTAAGFYDPADASINGNVNAGGDVNTLGTFKINGTPIAVNAVEHISYQPGLLTAVNATTAAFHKFSKASTVDNIEGSAATFTCTGNPTITVYECGTSATCAGPVTIGAVTVTTAGTVVDGSVSSTAIAAGDYVAFAMTAGTCASIDPAVTVQVHTN